MAEYLKKYDYAVIYNGVFYPADTPIPVKSEEKKTAAPVEDEKAADGKAETPEAEAAPVEDEKKAEKKAVKTNANKGKGAKSKANSKSAK